MPGRGIRQMKSLESYDEPLRRIVDELMASREHIEKKPLSRVQEYLEEAEHCTEKLTTILLKVERLVAVTAVLLFSIWGVIDLFIRLFV